MSRNLTPVFDRHGIRNLYHDFCKKEGPECRQHCKPKEDFCEHYA